MNTRCRRGLTIIECLLAVTILSFSVLVISYTVVAVQAQADAGDSLARAARLAHDLLEEIVSRPFDDPGGASQPGPEPGETRRHQFDNVDDYADYAESPGQLTDPAGTLHDPAWQVCGRSVTVVNSTQAMPDLGASFAGLLVTVTITEPKTGQWQFSRFIPRPLRN